MAEELRIMEKTKGGRMERSIGRTIIAGVLFITALVFFGYGTSYAKRGYLTSFESTYPAAKGTAIDVCILCHNSSSGGSRNSYGSAYGNSGHNFKTIEPLDSDGDTFSNINEIKDWSNPGVKTSIPVKPTVTAFIIPATSSSLVVKVTTFTATDNVKVTGYKLTTTATAPLATAGGWAALAPKNYSFPGQGAKTLFAWSKDAANNVSLSKSANVTITLTDTTKPVVTAFTAVASATAKVATITAFTATDNKKVTAYQVTETPTAPPAGGGGWSALAPTSYTSKTSGAKTLYGWARDAVGNVSLSKSSGPINLAVAAAPVAAGSAAAQATASAGGSLIPLPAGQETFSYDTAATPVRSADPAGAMPVGVSPSGADGTIDMQVSIGKFGGPVNMYLTMYAPAEKPSFAPVDVYSLQPDNTFKPVDMGQTGTGGVDAWKTNVNEVNEVVLSSMSQAELPAGQYLVVFTVTSANNENVYYEWMTHFIVR
jgi:hypothetical protein